MATGIAYQGLSAAIVITAIEKITKMIQDAEQRMNNKVGSAIEQVIGSIPRTPGEVLANYSDSRGMVTTALSGATLQGVTPTVGDTSSLIDQAVASFFDDYTGVLDGLFPGLMDAGENADRFVRGALESSIGVSYSELVDSARADTVFALARKQAHQQERDTLDAAASAGHRFAPGAALNAIGRLHAESTQAAAEAIAAAHASRLEQERSEKIRLVRAEIGQRMNRVKKLQAQVADAFRMKMRAHGQWVSDQNAVIESWNNQQLMPVQFSSRLDDLLREVTARRHASVVGGYQVTERGLDIGRLRLMNGQEVVDLLGNMVTTLQNQIRASGSYNGTERDVTDWDKVLA